ALPLAMLAAGHENGEIGAIVGAASVFNIGAALVSGGLIDRFGGRVVFLGGAGCFAVAGVLLATGLATAGGPVGMLLVVRLLQGIGLGAVMPAVLSMVPTLVERRHLPMALGFVGVAANLSLAVVPPLSLVVLDQASLAVLAAMTVGVMGAAALVVWPIRPQRGSAGPPPAPHSFRPKWRRAWLGPLAITLLFIVHWGVLTGYLPQRAAAAGADVGLFFTGDALALLAVRIPGSYLAGRFGSRWICVGGLAIGSVGLLLLLLPPTTPLLIAAGALSGAGAGLVLPTLLLDLTTRSDASDRGSAFALFSVAFSIGIALGSIGIAPVIDVAGFEVALAMGIAASALAAAVAVVDHPAVAARSGPAGSERALEVGG
ncbi:MAG: MFS transporter, partial [Chloroflexi bacterium]|nr:MFS transporter [Chloroflexota bacterium]